MTILRNMNFEEYFPGWRKSGVLIATVVVGSLILGIFVEKNLLIAIGFVITLVLALAVVKMPDAITPIVVIIVFTNAASIAVNFHNVPYIIGFTFPLMLVIPLAHYLIVRRQKLFSSRIFILIFLFLAVQLIGAIFSSRPDIVLDSVITTAMEGLVLFILLFNSIRNIRVLKLSIWALLISGAFLGFLSLYQQVTGTFDNSYAGFAQVSNAAFGTGVETLQGEVLQPRLAGPLGDQNYYAQFMLMVIPLGLFRFWSERSNLLRILAGIATAFVSLGVALTFSRGAAVGFILMLGIIIALRYIKLYQILIIALGLILVLKAVPQYGTRLSSLDILSGIFSSNSSTAIQSADPATKSRITEMSAAALVFTDYPLLGVGAGMYKHYYLEYAEKVGLRVKQGPRAAHDLYVEIAAETGIFGILIFLGILFISLFDLARLRTMTLQSRPDLANLATGFILAIITFMTTGVFLSLAYERYFWLLIALAAASVNVGFMELKSMSISKEE